MHGEHRAQRAAHGTRACLALTLLGATLSGASAASLRAAVLAQPSPVARPAAQPDLPAPSPTGRPVASGTRASRPAAARPATQAARLPVKASLVRLPAPRLSPPSRHVAPVHHNLPPSGPTDWPALNAAIAAIPGYAARGAQPVWHVGSLEGHWGTTVMNARPPEIYVSTSVPPAKLFSLVLHEYSHFVQMQDYAWSVTAMDGSVAAAFGLSEAAGSEYAADCMAILQGATWTNYTSCTSSRWRALARDLLAGHRL